MSKSLEARYRRQALEAEKRKRGLEFQIRLMEAWPVGGRTLASVAEEMGWTPAEARGAVAAARAEDGGSNITYAPDSRTFYWVPSDETASGAR